METANQDFRREFRASSFDPRYSGPLHLAGVVAVGGALLAAFGSQIHDPSLLELATIPLTLLYANVVEYFGHKGPMHRRYRQFRLLSGMWERHAAQHHVFFTRDSMTADGRDDWQIILAHPVFLVFFLGLIGAPSALVLALVATTNVVFLYLFTALFYGVSYEVLHLAYHFPADSWVGRLPGIPILRKHHQVHHDPRLMTKYNFNITIPLMDWLTGTWYPEPRPETTGAIAALGALRQDSTSGGPR